MMREAIRAASFNLLCWSYIGYAEPLCVSHIPANRNKMPSARLEQTAFLLGCAVESLS